METSNGDLWIGTYPYQRGKGGISITRADNQKSLIENVLNLLPEPPMPGQLPPGEKA